jgi:hypothetical protein
MQMDSLRAGSGLERSHNAHVSGGGAAGSQTTLAPLFNILRTIPPERVGLQGEYDHNGLAKRVELAFRQTFSPEEIARLKITQRGTVVMLVGCVASPRLLNRMVNVALSVDGAADVEVNGTSVSRPPWFAHQESDLLNRASYAC